MAIFREKNNGIEFRLKTAVHMIPSKQFPLASRNKSKIQVFHSETTELVQEDAVREVFDSFEYRIGACFWNANTLLKTLEQRGITGWMYYSGWLFPLDGYPVFHAWLVKDSYILDYTDSLFDEETMRAVEQIEDTQERRLFYAKMILERSKDLPSRNKVFGKAHYGNVYIGVQDSYENSLILFHKLDKNHPSYAEKGMSITNLSDLQQEIKKQ